MCKGVCYLSLSWLLSSCLLQNCRSTRHTPGGQFAEKHVTSSRWSLQARTSLFADCVWKEKTKRWVNLQTASCTLGSRRFAGAENGRSFCCERSIDCAQIICSSDQRDAVSFIVMLADHKNMSKLACRYLFGDISGLANVTTFWILKLPNFSIHLMIEEKISSKS